MILIVNVLFVNWIFCFFIFFVIIFWKMHIGMRKKKGLGFNLVEKEIIWRAKLTIENESRSTRKIIYFIVIFLYYFKIDAINYKMNK